MNKQRRSITIKIEDDGNPKERFDPTPYLETYIASCRKKSGPDPDSFTAGQYFLSSGVNLTAEAT